MERHNKSSSERYCLHIELPTSASFSFISNYGYSFWKSNHDTLRRLNPNKSSVYSFEWPTGHLLFTPTVRRVFTVARSHPSRPLRWLHLFTRQTARLPVYLLSGANCCPQAIPWESSCVAKDATVLSVPSSCLLQPPPLISALYSVICYYFSVFRIL